MNDNLSPADLKAVVGNNDNGFGGTDGGWLWLLLILAMMNGGWGFGGFGGGFGGFGGYGFGFDGMYPWLVNGQQDIMQNTNAGFDALQLSNQIGGVRDGIYGLSNQLCNCCADMTQTVSSGFANAETAANARQMANMNQAFNSQLSTVQGFNNVNSALCNASAENRLGQANLTSTILSENCADRYEAAKNTRDIIESGNRNSQAILDKLCQLELDGVKAQVEAKNDKIADLQRELSMADLRASQTAQNAFISQGFANEVDQLYNRLNSCPVPTTPVYRKNSDIYLQ